MVLGDFIVTNALYISLTFSPAILCEEEPFLIARLDIELVVLKRFLIFDGSSWRFLIKLVSYINSLYLGPIVFHTLDERVR